MLAKVAPLAIPPTSNTLPFDNKVALCPVRAADIDWDALNVLDAGS
jgi:hypothetical protein